MNAIILTWKSSLRDLLTIYETKRGSLITFFPKLFLFFVLLNILCYWWAMFTAFPHYIHGSEGTHYFLLQFPVGFLGAIFDSFSLFVTILIIRRALKSRSSSEYIAHLSLDLVIALVATCWVLFVFSFSGWIIGLFEANPEFLSVRNEAYEQRIVGAVVSPSENKRNIYFGVIMGISACLPTFVHISMFVRSGFRVLTGLKKVTIEE
ncbi:MAG: hypothetical protein JYX80_10820 [Candidatus Scalindua sediminis]|nr:hypothetical protein [Candidatus Scalindua sediminis]HDY66968.1 hypothetical protein [Candidatus Scalindua sp.]